MNPRGQKDALRLQQKLKKQARRSSVCVVCVVCMFACPQERARLDFHGLAGDAGPPCLTGHAGNTHHFRMSYHDCAASVLHGALGWLRCAAFWPS